MKFKYIKPNKLNYNGKQYHSGDVLEMDEFDNVLPADWFREVEEEIEEEIKPKEVEAYGNIKSPNKNLDSKRGRNMDSKSK